MLLLKDEHETLDRKTTAERPSKGHYVMELKLSTL